MKKDYTDIIIFLDRSGSMSTIKKDMVGGIKSFIDDQKKLPGQCLVTLIQFDGNGYDNVFTAKPISEVGEVPLVPGGSTPLLDSLARAITETGKRYADMADADRPEFIVFLIITDGEENASREFKRNQIKDMINLQTDVYKWNFTYLGANQDAFSEASQLGIRAFQTMEYKPSEQGIRSMYNSVSSATSMLRTRMANTLAYVQDDYDKQAKAGLIK